VDIRIQMRIYVGEFRSLGGCHDIM